MFVYKKAGRKKIGFLCLGIDDLIVSDISENFCDWFHAEVSQKLTISDYSDLA